MGTPSAGGAFLPAADYNVTGAWGFKGAVTSTGTASYTGAETHTGTESHSGTETHTGTETHSGSATFSAVTTLSAGFVDDSEALTTAGLMSAYGLSTITIASSSNGTTAFTVPAPIAGVRKTIASVTSSTGGVSTATLVSGTVNGTNGIMTFSSQGFISLFGVSTARWVIDAISTGTVTLS